MYSNALEPRLRTVPMQFGLNCGRLAPSSNGTVAFNALGRAYSVKVANGKWRGTYENDQSTILEA